MKVDIPKGKYVLAVSGGVDSMVLLDILSKMPGIELVVAHFNHGIRDDADKDEEVVRSAANSYELPFELDQARLGAGASEERAREARYEFLEKVKDRHQAKAIVTAHHQDDMIETAIINILRGTGPRGLVAISRNLKVMRPLLHLQKDEILAYAKLHNLTWREDITNQDEKYLRNYVRRNIVPKLGKTGRRQIIGMVEGISAVIPESQRLIEELAEYVAKDGLINRQRFSSLPYAVGNELMTFWLRRQGLGDFDKKTVNRLNLAVRTAKAGTSHDVARGIRMAVDSKSVSFQKQA